MIVRPRFEEIYIARQDRITNKLVVYLDDNRALFYELGEPITKENLILGFQSLIDELAKI